MPDGTSVNLFCSSHAFLADGKLFVAGGHLQDGNGVNQACLYDWKTDAWEPLSPMNLGRWYPAVTILPDGTVLVTSGSTIQGGQAQNNPIPQTWTQAGWRDFNGKILSLYPRQFAVGSNRVFVAGTSPVSEFFALGGLGTWTDAPSREHGDRQYAPAVMFRPGTIIYIGGGNEPTTNVPTAACEIIDLGAAAPAWRPTAPMAFPRRQHNATLLPDGTILVTGGTRGGGGIDNGFNDLTPNQPVHEAELFDPATETWTTLAAETNDRCYHSTAVLLLDATVLSAGGGEYNPGGQPIARKDVHTDGQVFQPPYLNRGARPEILSAPDAADYGSTLVVTVAGAPVARVTALKPISVTHAMDTNQRFMELAFETDTKAGSEGKTLTISLAVSRDDYPPGFYMLFALSDAGVPSVARMIRIGEALPPGPAGQAVGQPSLHLGAGLAAHNATLASASVGTPVTIGLTSRCPYGLAACWGGAYQTLKALSGVQSVMTVADATDSTAGLFMAADALPDIDLWLREFNALAKGGYDFRGVEITVAGTAALHGAELVLTGSPSPWTVTLEPMAAQPKVQWDWAVSGPAAPDVSERDAFRQLVLRVQAGGAIQARVTGPVRNDGHGPRLAVRLVN